MSAHALSGQDTSKGRIKAAAHAKDGDCFGCLITPLRTTLCQLLCHLGMHKVLLMFCLMHTDTLPYFTKFPQFNKLRHRHSCNVSSHSFTSGETCKLEQPSAHQPNMMRMLTQLNHTQANSKVLGVPSFVTLL